MTAPGKPRSPRRGRLSPGDRRTVEDLSGHPAFLDRLSRWRKRGRQQEYAKAELPPRWDSPPRWTAASRIEAAGHGPRRPEWGPWDIDRATCALWTAAAGYRYEVSLEDCTASAQVLDAICQVAGKQWQDRDRVIAGLVTALDDILNPQATLCPSGRPAQLSKTAIRALIRNTAPETFR